MSKAWMSNRQAHMRTMYVCVCMYVCMYCKRYTVT